MFPNLKFGSRELDENVPIEVRLIRRQYPRPKPGEQWPSTLATYSHDTSLVEFANSDNWRRLRTVTLQVKRCNIPDNAHRCDHIKEGLLPDHVQRKTNGCKTGDCYVITYDADNDLIPPITDKGGKLLRKADGEPEFDGTRGCKSWSVPEKVWEPAKCEYYGGEGSKLGKGITAMYFVDHVDSIAEAERDKLLTQSMA